MGSAALGEAIKGIRSWAMNEGRVVQTPANVKDIFGARVFNDKVQQARLPKPVYKSLRDTMTRRHGARCLDRGCGRLRA